jgi:hypothetical protein
MALDLGLKAGAMSLAIRTIMPCSPVRPVRRRREVVLGANTVALRHCPAVAQPVLLLAALRIVVGQGMTKVGEALIEKVPVPVLPTEREFARSPA